MPEIVYLLCMATSIACATLLTRGYFKFRQPLLLWSGICFCGLALNNLFLFLDVVVVPYAGLGQIDKVDLAPWRLVPALFGMMALIYGILKEALFHSREE